MSENPNPTRCGNCGTVNPPGQEFCISCHAPLTIAADAAALEETPEGEDEIRREESGREDVLPEVVIMGGMGGAPIPVPSESVAPDAAPLTRD
ncbi:MAG TPA: zinc-ribbon domain-containing protein [Thermomicrobiales bacterium]|nr:zinc-ribbon domain-containing protein [Thermomicrobiales bacterium]